MVLLGFMTLRNLRKIVSAQRERGKSKLRFPVREEARRDHEVVELGHLEALDAFRGVKLCRAEAHRLLALRVRAGKDDDARAHFGEELNRKVSQATEADDDDAVRWADVEVFNHLKDGRAAAHEPGGVLWCEAVRNFEEE